MKSVQTSYTQEVLCHDFVSQVHRIILHMNGKILISVVNSDHQDLRGIHVERVTERVTDTK